MPDNNGVTSVPPYGKLETNLTVVLAGLSVLSNLLPIDIASTLVKTSDSLPKTCWLVALPAVKVATVVIPLLPWATTSRLVWLLVIYTTPLVGAKLTASLLALTTSIPPSILLALVNYPPPSVLRLATLVPVKPTPSTRVPRLTLLVRPKKPSWLKSKPTVPLKLPSLFMKIS